MRIPQSAIAGSASINMTGLTRFCELKTASSWISPLSVKRLFGSHQMGPWPMRVITTMSLRVLLLERSNHRVWVPWFPACCQSVRPMLAIVAMTTAAVAVLAVAGVKVVVAGVKAVGVPKLAGRQRAEATPCSRLSFARAKPDIRVVQLKLQQTGKSGQLKQLAQVDPHPSGASPPSSFLERVESYH